MGSKMKAKFSISLHFLMGSKMKAKFSITALFNNTQTLTFDSQLTIFSCCQSLLWSQAMGHETQKHKMGWNSPITRLVTRSQGLLRWLTAAKNKKISWLLYSRTCVLLKSTITSTIHGLIFLFLYNMLSIIKSFKCPVSPDLTIFILLGALGTY